MCQRSVGSHGSFVKWPPLLIPEWKVWLLKYRLLLTLGCANVVPDLCLEREKKNEKGPGTQWLQPEGLNLTPGAAAWFHLLISYTLGNAAWHSVCVCVCLCAWKESSWAA